MPRTLEPTIGSDEPISLDDGTAAMLRPITPDDAVALRRFHAGLSPRSVRLRYFYPHADLRDDEVAHLTQVDGRDRVALVAERAGELVAVGRYDRLALADRAEVAFVVSDAFQHHGLATLLLQRLASVARSAGIRALVAEVLAENRDMLSVFKGSGFPTTFTSEWGTVELTMDIAAPAPHGSGDQTGTLQQTRVPRPGAG